MFTTDGSCAANVDAAILPLVADDKTINAGAIRLVAVDPRWRGQGLFRELMTEALAWCDERANGPTLLYTEEPVLYRRFGFRQTPQHAFVGDAPAPRGTAPAQRLTMGSVKDVSLVCSAVRYRTHPSMQCALLVDAPQVLANLAKDGDLSIFHDARHDVVVVCEVDGDLLTLVDVISPAMPDLSAILGTLPLAPRRVRTLFPPDRLGWQGTPVAEDTGLMVRGAVPVAMMRPFMFPPTGEF